MPNLTFRTIASITLLMSCANAFAADEKPVTTAAQTPSTLPPYSFPYRDGLYASAAGYVAVKDVCFTCQKTELLDVEGFCGKFPVKAGIQSSAAPLVVILLGVGGRPEDDFNKLWAAWYFEAGYHVVTFDSTFLQEFNERSHLGVGGNVWVETDYVAKIVDAFVHQSSASGRITKIGVVGMSYGGVQSLMLGVRKLPFEIAAIQAYSPPIRMDQSARIIDGWYAETYGKYTLVELLKLQKIKPDPSNPESPISESMLKAAVSTSFRYALPALVAYSDSEYHLNKLPRGDEFTDKYVRLDYATKWSFSNFAYGMTYPYWQRKLGVANLEPLIHAADLPALIEKQPETTEVILAQDDPLNAPADMDGFKKFATGKRVTILPNGGHLGYVSEPWTRAKLLTLFDAK
jgi:predicted alpha/beta-fold hydrolase